MNKTSGKFEAQLNIEACTLRHLRSGEYWERSLKLLGYILKKCSEFQVKQTQGRDHAQHWKTKQREALTAQGKRKLPLCTRQPSKDTSKAKGQRKDIQNAESKKKKKLWTKNLPAKLYFKKEGQNGQVMNRIFMASILWEIHKEVLQDDSKQQQGVIWICMGEQRITASVGEAAEKPHLAHTAGV